MKLKLIRASAGCTVPHPYQSYSNLKLFVELTAELKPGEAPVPAVVELQDMVNGLLSTERAKRLNELETEHAEEEKRNREERDREEQIWKAEREIETAQRKLEQLRKGEAEDGIPF